MAATTNPANAQQKIDTTNNETLDISLAKIQSNFNSLFGFVPGGGATPGELSPQSVIITAFASTALNATSSANQPIFAGISTAGQVNLPVGTYMFECQFGLAAMAAASSFGFALGASTAVIGSQSWISTAQKGTKNSPTAPLTSWNVASSANIAASAASTVGYAMVQGYFTLTTAGGVIPQVALNNSSAATVDVGSFFWCSPVAVSVPATTGGLKVGNWV